MFLKESRYFVEMFERAGDAEGEMGPVGLNVFSDADGGTGALLLGGLGARSKL